MEEGVAGFVGGAHPLELPSAVKAEEVGRRLQGVCWGVSTTGITGRSHGDVQRVGALTIETGDADIVPFLKCLCADGQAADDGHDEQREAGFHTG